MFLPKKLHKSPFVFLQKEYYFLLLEITKKNYMKGLRVSIYVLIHKYLFDTNFSAYFQILNFFYIFSDLFTFILLNEFSALSRENQDKGPEMGCLIDERNVSRVLDYLCMHAQYPKVTLYQVACFFYNLVSYVLLFHVK